jgi:hypothetical protein
MAVYSFSVVEIPIDRIAVEDGGYWHLQVVDKNGQEQVGDDGNEASYVEVGRDSVADVPHESIRHHRLRPEPSVEDCHEYLAAENKSVGECETHTELLEVVKLKQES